MEHPGFFERAGPFSVAEIAAATKAELMPGADPDIEITDVRALTDASPATCRCSTIANTSDS
jgi:UDP-3-O-[3-hydroxymyristoyl] glucosamine N-acyltransferase